jgi:hypothetical protein
MEQGDLLVSLVELRLYGDRMEVLKMRPDLRCTPGSPRSTRAWRRGTAGRARTRTCGRGRPIIGLGRIVALYCRSSTLYQVCLHIWCLYF